MHIVIDSSSLGHQARFSTGELSYQSVATGVIYGFFRQVLSLVNTLQTTNLIFCWDGRSYLRKKLYPEYKKSRSQEQLSPEEKKELELAYIQFEQIYGDILPVLGFRNNFQVHGYEADDIIAYIVKEYDSDFVVVSSDQDLYQLLDYCRMYSQKRKAYYTKNHFVKDYGIQPSQWIDVKAICGCSSDNVEGIKGVGEKTASKYVHGALSETTQAFRKIQDEVNAENDYYAMADPNQAPPMLVRNRRLVSLPMEGFPGVELVPDVCGSYSDFEMMARKYGFKSLLSGRMADEWKALFHRRQG